MKKSLAVCICVIVIMASLCACGGAAAEDSGNNEQSTAQKTEESATADNDTSEAAAEAATDTEDSSGQENPEQSAAEEEEEPVIEIEIENTRWKSDDHDIYYFFEPDGKVTEESVSTGTSKSTVNGITTSQTTRSVLTWTFSWERSGNEISINGGSPYTIVEEDGTYKLKKEGSSYTLTDEDPNEQTGEVKEDKESIDLDPELYTLNETIKTDTLELTFTEQGISDDIRVTSKESGISITSGPAPESGKRFIYLKGTAKNLGKSAVNANLSGVFDIDGYSYNMKGYMASTAANSKSSIDPFESIIVILYAAVPEELIDSFDTANLLFGFNENFAPITTLHECDYVYITTGFKS